MPEREERDRKPTLADALLLSLIQMMGPFAANTYIPAFPALPLLCDPGSGGC